MAEARCGAADCLGKLLVRKLRPEEASHAHVLVIPREGLSVLSSDILHCRIHALVVRCDPSARTHARTTRHMHAFALLGVHAYIRV